MTDGPVHCMISPDNEGSLEHRNVLTTVRFNNHTATHFLSTEHRKKFSSSKLRVLSDLFNHEGLAFHPWGPCLVVPQGKKETFHFKVRKI